MKSEGPGRRLLIVAAYAVFGAGWILFGHLALVAALGNQPGQQIELVKGLAFVAVSCLVIWSLLAWRWPAALAGGVVADAPAGQAAARGVARRAWLGFAAIVLLSGLIVAALLYALREEALRIGERDTATQALLVEQQAVRSLEAVDFHLKGVLEGLRAPGAGAANGPQRQLERMASDLDFVRDAWVMDASGRALYASDPRGLGADFSDREYFRAHLAGERGLYVGAPLTGRVSGERFITLSRAHRAPDGRLLHVVNAGVRVSRFQQLWQRVPVGDQGSISLFGDDYVLLIRFPELAGTTGQSFAGRGYLPALGTDVRALSFRSRSLVDGVERLFSFRRSVTYPQLSVVVGHAVGDVLAQWTRFAVFSVTGWLLSMFGIAVLVRILLRQWRLQLHVREQMRLADRVFDASAQGILVTDTAANILRVNPAFECQTGYAAGEVLGRKPSLLKSGRHPREFYADLWAALLRDGHWTGEIWNRRKSGEVFPGQLSIDAVRDADNRVSQYVAILTDSTERVRAEQERLRMLERLQQAQRVGGIGDWDYDPQARAFTWWSPETFALYGIEVSDGPPTMDVLKRLAGDEAVASIEAMLRECARSGTRQQAEVRLLRPSAAGVHHLWLAEPGPDQPGGRRVSGVVQDISVRKASEIALRASSEFNQATLDALPGHICVLDERGDVIAVNRSWETFARENGGVGRGAGVGANYLAVCDRAAAAGDMDAVGFARGLREVLGGRADRFSYTYPCDSPTEARWFQAHLSRFESGGRQRVVVVHENITSRRQAELASVDRARQQGLVAALGRDALAMSDLEQVFASAARMVCEGLGVTFSTLTEIGPDGRSHVIRAVQGWGDEWIGRRIAAEGRPDLFDHVVQVREPVIVEDFREITRFARSELIEANEVLSGLGVVIAGAARIHGTLWVYSRQPRRFSAAQVSFLQSVAFTLEAAIERHMAEERNAHLAQHDLLTELPNRLLFRDRLGVAISQARRAGGRLALLFVDLDRFKNVNDSFGHDFGDRLLREVARRLAAAVRAADTVSRQGGDEFLVLLPSIDEEADAAHVAGKLVSAMTQPFGVDGQEILLSASVGIACFPDNGEDVETLVRNADAAMYAAKTQGRNRYEFYSSEMNARARERLALEIDLRRAIARGELFLEYQPQVRFDSGRPVGVEALLRWRHASLGLVPPAQFIPIAEDSGLIAEIGAWVLATACGQAAAWRDAGVPFALMSVNVSVQQFRQPGFVDSVRQALAGNTLDPGTLELEITESVMVQGIDMARRKLEELKALGVGIAIDDFGTGYSSLSYLKQLPIGRLKIDQSFVSSLPDDQESAAIARAVIAMGHSLGMDVVAEGVETEAQAETLGSMWCEAGQGYYFARPLMAEACAEFLRERSRDAVEARRD